ncbi:MAG TPA: ceramidase domain-containing protein [Pyrinomonadaceae bacterium]|nr:ceramidase domain-containing protein [Pyrinomonadaceae bacterium]
MTPETRGFVVWIAATVVILIAFFIFVATGFPGEKDTCVDDRPHNTCYCEKYNEREINQPGIRQPSNTWFNLYAVGTSFLVALFIYFDRKKYAGSAPNVIGSNSFIADLYIFAVLFLGLGSMWFHASLTTWGGVFDGISMYVYAAYLVFYSIRRFWNADWFFWVGYGATVILFTILHAAGVPSVINIMILVAAYAAIEIYIWVRTGKWMQGKTLTRALWIGSLVSILLATVFWALSQTGGPLCDPESAFQPHGMLWHPLAGLMAVLLYFYWREADDRI